jgi:hypothetical protein
MKYMILVYGSQQDYDSMAGQAGPGRPAWSAEDFAALGAFMESFTKDLADSGELIETRGLTAPVHARRIQLRNDVPVVTDGPYAESQEVLAGYWIVECDSFDRATEIAARLTEIPGPADLERAVVDVRPIADSRAELEAEPGA